MAGMLPSSPCAGHIMIGIFIRAGVCSKRGCATNQDAFWVETQLVL
jgi:hypothetical protein